MSDFPSSKFFPSRLSLPQRFSELLKRFGVPVFERQVRKWDATGRKVIEQQRVMIRERRKYFERALDNQGMRDRKASPDGEWYWATRPLFDDTMFVKSWMPSRLKAKMFPQEPRALIPIPKGKLSVPESCALLGARFGHHIEVLEGTKQRPGPYALLLYGACGLSGDSDASEIDKLTKADDQRLFNLLDFVFGKFKEQIPEVVGADAGEAAQRPGYDMDATPGTKPIPWTGYERPSYWCRVMKLPDSRAFTSRCKSGSIVHQKLDEKAYRIDARHLPADVG